MITNLFCMFCIKSFISHQLSNLDFYNTLMLIRSVIRGTKTISSPSQLCREFTSIRPFSFHRWRPYRMKI